MCCTDCSDPVIRRSLVKIFTSNWLLPGTLICILAPATPGMAHLPGLFGKEFIRLEAEPEGVAPVSPELQMHPPGNEDRLQYDKLLADTEMAGGAYAAGLTDPLINLGYYYQKRGYIKDAIEAYRRALHVVRMNDGLSSAEQLPILRNLVEIYQSISDYSSLGEVYQYYYRVSELNEPPRSRARLDERLEYLAWERELYISRSDGGQRAHLLRAYRANAEMLEAFEPTTDEELDWYIRLALSQMSQLYLLLSEDPIPMQGGIINTGNGPAADWVNRQLASIQTSAFRRGKRLLQDCIEQAQPTMSVGLAALHLELGDWYQWNGELHHANDQYERVIEVLRAAGQEPLIIQWLGQPMELPDETDYWLEKRNIASSEHAVVAARYDVTSRGDVKKIKATVVEEENVWQARRIKRMLRETHFRPRFSQGQPETVEQVLRHYMLTDAH